MPIESNQKKNSKYFYWPSFLKGAKAILPLSPGVIPFGMFMGVTTTSTGLSFVETMIFNFPTFAGASQLAAIDLYLKDTPLIIIFLTCLIINMRFSIYSFSLAPYLNHLPMRVKLILAYFIYDQAFGVTIKDLEDEVHTSPTSFFVGAGIVGWSIWQFGTILGVLIGNIIPKGLNIDFSIPLIFMAMLIPLIRNRKMLLVAIFSSITSLIFFHLPLNLGIITTVFVSMTLAFFLERKSGVSNG